MYLSARAQLWLPVGLEPTLPFVWGAPRVDFIYLKRLVAALRLELEFAGSPSRERAAAA